MAEGVSELEKVDAGFEAVSGVGVPEDFGADTAAEVGCAGVVGDDVLQERGGEGGAIVVDEEGTPGAVAFVSADDLAEEVEELGAEGDVAGSLAFASDFDLHQGGIDIGDLEGDELGGAEAKLIEGADNGVVGGAFARDGEEFLHLGFGEVGGLGGFDAPGEGEIFCGVCGNGASFVEEEEVEPEGGDFAVERDVFEGMGFFEEEKGGFEVGLGDGREGLCEEF